MDDLIRIFDENGINKSPSIFDTNKLTWFNAEYIRRLTPEAYAEMAKPWLSQVLDPQKFDLDRLCQLLQARTEIFSQLPGMVDFLAEMPALDMALFTNKRANPRRKPARRRSNLSARFSPAWPIGRRPTSTIP